ncbi:MAG: hypothetical protein WBD99_02570 [Thermodesulfobacteriota bacterium]
MNEEDSLKSKSNEIQREVEKALDQRVSLENLFSQKFSDLNSQSQKDIDSRFRDVKIYGMLGLIILALLGVIGYWVLLDKAGQFVTQQIDKKLIDPELTKAVENLVSTKLQPLEQHIQQVNTTIQSKQRDLADVQAQLGQVLEIQQLSIGARAGSRADYEKLLQLSKSKEENIRKSADAAIQDLQYYFSADRFQLTGNRTLGDPKTRGQIFFSVEELAQELGNQEDGRREGAVNLVADSKKKYLVGYLVEMLSKESNLRVCVRITRALQLLTEERAFEPLAFDAVASWWDQNNGKEEYAWPFYHYFDGLEAMKAGSLDEALIHFDRMIENEPQAFLSMVYKGRILTLQGKYGEAEKAFKQVEDTRNDFRWLYVWRAFFFLNQNNQSEAVNSINRALEISPGIEGFIRSQHWAQPLLSDKTINWSSHQDTQINKGEIRQDER